MIIVATILAVVLVRSTQDSPSVPRTRAELQRDPAAQLQMPGAVKLADGGSDEEITVEGTRYASVSQVFGTSAAQSPVETYYDDQLRRLGWTPDRYVISTTAEIDAVAWCKPGVFVRLGFLNQADTRNRGYLSGGQRFATLFEAAVLVRSPQVGCPGL